jgi:hypothetical protein
MSDASLLCFSYHIIRSFPTWCGNNDDVLRRVGTDSGQDLKETSTFLKLLVVSNILFVSRPLVKISINTDAVSGNANNMFQRRFKTGLI